MAKSSRRRPAGLAALATLSGLEPAQRTFLEQRLVSEQNLPLAVLAGSAAALLGAGGWAAITVLSGYKLGIVAIAVGMGVGLAVRRMGRGVTPIFAAMGGALAFVACGAGNLLVVAALMAQHGGVPLATVLGRLDLSTARRLMVSFSTPMDALFYGIAVLAAYRASLRPIGPAEAQALLAGPSAPGRLKPA